MGDLTQDIALRAGNIAQGKHLTCLGPETVVQIEPRQLQGNTRVRAIELPDKLPVETPKLLVKRAFACPCRQVYPIRWRAMRLPRRHGRSWPHRGQFTVDTALGTHVDMAGMRRQDSLRFRL